MRRGRTGGASAANPDRHIVVGVSHPSGDPARHRVFEVRARYVAEAAGWIAETAEQNANEQPGLATAAANGAPVFADPATCLGAAVAAVVARVERDDLV